MVLNCSDRTWLQLVIPPILKLSFQMFPPKIQRIGSEISFSSKYSWRTSSQLCPKKILRHLNKHFPLWFQRPIKNKKLNVYFCFSGKLAAEPNVNTGYYKTKQSENSAVWTSVVSGYRIQKVTLDLFI